MEAKAIYNACRHLTGAATWHFAEGSEWSYVGEGDAFELKRAESEIAQFFKGGSVYVVVDRQTAFAVPVTAAATSVKEHLKGRDVTLCDESFTKAMIFSRVGVVKHGRTK